MAHNSGYTKLFVDRTDPNNPVGISLGEIRRCLYGVSGGAGVDLSRSPNINKWAKFKPMPAGDMSGYTDTQAKLINYGLFVPYYTSFNSMVLDIQAGTWTRATNYDSTKTPWQNLGLGVNDWSRVLDFDGYRSTAEPVMTQVTSDNSEYYASDQPTFSTISQNAKDDCIGPSDIRITDSQTLYENFYYGLYYHCSAGGYYKIFGRCNTLGNGTILFYDQSFNFSRTEFEDSVVVCPFFCNYNLNNGDVGQSTSVPGGIFVPIIPARDVLQLTFYAPRMYPECDSSYWVKVKTDGNLAFVIRSYPDSSATLGCTLEATYRSSGVEHTVLQTGTFNVSLVPNYDSLTETQKPFYIRMDTDRVNSQLDVKVYLTDDTVDFHDVFDNEQSLGTPYATTMAPITSGEILSSAGVASLTDGALFSASFMVGSTPAHSEACPMGRTAY